jgi:hypothetical protein
MDIKRMAYGAAGKQSMYLGDSDALSAIRSRLNRLKTELGDLA